MKSPKINLVYESFSIQQLKINAIIKKCICAVLEAEKVEPRCEVNVLVTNDQGIRTINKTSRNIDKPTDVLSFPMFELEPGTPPADWEEFIDPETGMCPLGDMAISLERAVAQANEYGHSVRREVGYLTIHSMLHLLGYDHMDEGPQKAQMRMREEQIALGIKGMRRD